MSAAALQFEGVIRRFGAKVAVDGLDLRVEPGTILGLVGRNGSGKTTSLRLAHGLLWPDADVADIQIGKPHKVIFTNSSSRLHPMHLHGVFFRVLERNGKPNVEPFTRDTVLVGPHERVVIGFIPMHPGIWLTHCHIQSHAEAGMMTTITVE